MDAPVIDLQSLGNIAGESQTSVSILQRAVTELRIVPAQRLNGVPYFDAASVSRIVVHAGKLKSAAFTRTTN